MTGVGRVFAAFRDGILTDDDEVAVLHGPEELGLPGRDRSHGQHPRHTRQGSRGGCARPRARARLTEIGKTLFYKERSWEAILAPRRRPRSVVEAA